MLARDEEAFNESCGRATSSVPAARYVNAVCGPTKRSGGHPQLRLLSTMLIDWHGGRKSVG